MHSVLVLGIGNTLLRDDGAGVHAALQLGRSGLAPEGLRILDAGTLGFVLLPELDGRMALLVFDAARNDSTPGTVFVREGAAMDAFVRRRGRSVHEVGLADLIDMARLRGSLPERRALIGIEPEVIDWGIGCTETVERALPEAVKAALNVLARWRAGCQSLEVEYAA
jgi:hydrogenase maturation protease